MKEVIFLSRRCAHNWPIVALCAQRAELNDVLLASTDNNANASSTAPQLFIDETSLKASLAAIQEQEAELVDNMEDINSLKGNAANRLELVNLR